MKPQPHTFVPDLMGDCSEQCNLPENNDVHVPAEPPSLPYDGTSGHTGTDTSRERAERRDSTGLTGATQQQISGLVLGSGHTGLTIAELRAAVPGDHHGTLSGTLSVLHKEARIAMLTAKRGGCHIYVSPQYVEGRETREQGHRKSRLTADDLRLLGDAKRLGDEALSARTRLVVTDLLSLVTRLNGGATT